MNYSLDKLIAATIYMFVIHCALGTVPKGWFAKKRDVNSLELPSLFILPFIWKMQKLLDTSRVPEFQTKAETMCSRTRHMTRAYSLSSLHLLFAPVDKVLGTSFIYLKKMKVRQGNTCVSS